MSGLSKHQKATRKGNGTPDSWDVQAILDEIYSEFRAAAELHIYQTLTSDLVVECMATRYRADGSRQDVSAHRIFNTASPALLSLMLIVAHDCYHQMDRDKGRCGG